MKHKKVLVVEDDHGLRQMIKKVFELSGIEVDSVCHGKEALEYLNREQAPALMLLDLMMPVMTGPELLDKLNEENRLHDFPIVLVSSLANNKALNPYGLPTVMKPVGLQTLMELGNHYCLADLA